jgi:two-component system NtrC family sensor kinase
VRQRSQSGQPARKVSTSGPSVGDLQKQLDALSGELKEAREQQTATAEVLQVINSSPGDLAPIFDTMLQKALSLCGAAFGQLVTFDGEVFRAAAWRGYEPGPSATAPLPGMALHQLVHGEQIVHIPDITADDVYRSGNPVRRRLADKYGGRTAIWVALRKDDELLGAFVIFRTEVRPFSDKQIALLQGFAAQAVIAIENARLFNEVQARTRGLSESLQFQTASAEVLKVISRSPDALQPVFDVIVETSRELCRAQASTIFTLRDGRIHVAAFAGVQTEVLQHMKDHPIPIEQRGSALARSVREKRTVHIPNTAEDPEFGEGSIIGMGEPRATLTVPLMREGQVIGGITLRQSNVTPFTQRQIEAIETFADQAAIAIANVGLFEQVQQRTRELSKSLDDLRTAQDRLIQTEKLASLGQITAGIAHEIKNPLNFVNNFSALSAELTDELNDLLKSATLAEDVRRDVGELTGLLKDNLGKVVQHGKRADAIVKNMLLHSREGSGEHRIVDINAIVEESLNLAWHGARAEKQGFEIMLERSFDPAAGEIDLYPQDMTRALLNLISNGFYAATRRKADANGGEHVPTLVASTKGLGDRVEIRIRDNGTGIPPEVKAKMFTPFFTTKPAGEGTGLGLSISHDIIVKRHGGSIEVESQPGEFTEIRVVLPRVAALFTEGS